MLLSMEGSLKNDVEEFVLLLMKGDWSSESDVFLFIYTELRNKSKKIDGR